MREGAPEGLAKTGCMGHGARHASHQHSSQPLIPVQQPLQQATVMPVAMQLLRCASCS